MYRSLLVPLDGSLFSEQALPLAMSIARRAGASLRVTSVAVDPWFALSSANNSENWLNSWRAYLQQVVERLRAHGAVPVTFDVLEGNDVAPRISAHAESIGADLIIMATHGRGALGRFWLGSVPYTLMHISPLPLLLVTPGVSVAEWETESVPQHVLVPLDGSSHAERIIEPAVELGSLMDADYTLLRVINDTPLGTPGLDSISLSSLAHSLIDEIRSVQERVRKEAQDYLDCVAEELRARGLRVQTRVDVANDPGTAIVTEAETAGIDLVALETHGRHGLSNLVIGSVARKVVHGTSKPVLVQSTASARQSD